ncbi:hypothetical protein HYH03_001335 [Edaphochlamys debaryana]|uniref:Uncharacterized protein n=1 Tax=Edaphochlamys debaryana TaxID=47281 RepID=A0A835YF09_9CHLO|nr:hypothetical protein HYH03_001335 [Edaphochlamys debaryana]|eukprot:KAG2500564.1 hypothetical protein HYH03_001335 [Edaphochlamys debaryana]
MAAQVLRGPQLAALPFPWAAPLVASGSAAPPPPQPHAPAAAAPRKGPEATPPAVVTNPAARREGAETTAGGGLGVGQGGGAGGGEGGPCCAVCLVLRSTWAAERRRQQQLSTGEESTGPVGGPTGHLRGSSGSGTGVGSGSVDDGSAGGAGGGGAAGSWRRLCTCRRRDGGGQVRGGSGQGLGPDDGAGGELGAEEDDDGEEEEWGSMQHPQMALLRRGPGSLPPSPGHLGPGGIGGGGATSLSQGHGDRAEGGARDGPGGKGGGGRGGLWSHSAWAERVWHLPPRLAPPVLPPSPPQPPSALFAAHLPHVNRPGALASASEACGDRATTDPRDAEAVGGESTTAATRPDVVDWLSYYRWARLPLESPAALLLHFPLTLYGALRRVDELYGGALWDCRTTDVSGRVGGAGQVVAPSAMGCSSGAAMAAGTGGPLQPVGSKRRREEESEDPGAEVAPGLQRPREATASPHRVWDAVYLGPQAELDALDSFAALLPLLPPATTLRMHMVGPDVPYNLDGCTALYDSDLDSAAAMTAAEACGPPVPEAGATARCVGAAPGPGGGGSAGDCVRHQGHAGPSGARLEILLHSGTLHDVPHLLHLVGASGDGGGEEGCGAARHVTPTPTAGPSGGVVGHVPARGQGPAPGPEAGVGATRDGSGGCGLPVVVFGANAGLPVYLSWLPTLQLLAGPGAGAAVGAEAGPVAADAGSERTRRAGEGAGAAEGTAKAGPGAASGRPGDLTAEAPEGAALSTTCAGVAASERGPSRYPRRPLAVMFTAYNEDEAVRSERLLAELYGVRLALPPTVNPFRQPLACVDRVGNELPSYSNGFMYGWTVG